MRDIALVLAVLIGTVYAIRSPVFGYIAFVGASLFNPHTYTWGFARTFPFAQLLAIGTLVGFAFWSEPRTFRYRREGVILLILWAWLVVTSTFADYPDLAFEKFADVSKILLLPVLSVAIINTRFRVHALMRTIAVALGVYALNAGIFVILTGGNYMVWGPDGTFLGANNAIGLAMVMNLPLLRYLAPMERNPWVRRFYWAMFLASYPAIVATYSRGAWLGMAAATGLMILKSRYRVVVAVVLALAFLAILPHLPDRAVNRYDDLRNYEEEGSAQSRIWNWRFAIRVTQANPILGAGFRYYGIPAYHRYFPEFLAAWPGKAWSCHSIWFTMLSEHGIPGALLFVVLLFGSVRNTFRISRLATTDERAAWAKPFAEMIQVSLLAYMVSGTFYDAAFFDLLYTLLMALICIQNVAEQPQGPGAVPVTPARPVLASGAAMRSGAARTAREA